VHKFIAFISKVFIVFCLLLPAAVHASTLTDYEESRKIYLAATACMAIYSDRVGGFALDALHQDGWQVESYVKTSSKVNARFLLASKVQTDGNQPVYMLAMAGTETFKDVLTNLLVSKVYFAGRTPEEFAANAERKDMPDTAPKVHKGYNQFVQIALTAEGQKNTDSAKRKLTEILLDQPAGKLYLVGHSMGGATATVAAARLVSMGVQPEQLEIITFGAPAVGNEAFRKEFEPVLHLTRIVTSGDPIIEVLRDLVGSYKQFGQEISWDVSTNALVMPHAMAMYLDTATKHYYWNRHQAMEAGTIPVSVDQTIPDDGVSRVYVAPIKNHLSKGLQAEFFYMKEALQDEYRRTFPGYVIDTAQESGDVFKKAAAAGCQWVLATEIQDHKIKNLESGYYMTLEQSVYRVDTGNIVSVASYGRTTRTTTPLQALIHDGTNLSRDSHDWLISAQAK
jgi:surfactin synthase thioesterase subunit